MAEFGQVDWQNHVGLEDAAKRVYDYEIKFDFRDRIAARMSRYMAPIDVEPTEYDNIYRAEWEQTICGHQVVRQGYVAVLQSEHGRREFHATTMHEALLAVTRAEKGLEGLKEPIHKSKYFTRSMAKSLGWCNPGINQWVSENVAGKVRVHEGEDAVPIKVLWDVISGKAHRNQYEIVLFNLLKGHPEIDDAS